MTDPAPGWEVSEGHNRVKCNQVREYTTAHAVVAGAAPLMTRHRTTSKQYEIKPARIKVDWARDGGASDWDLKQVTVTGQRLRQDGQGTLPGSERSVEWRASDLHEAPQWVQRFVHERHP